MKLSAIPAWLAAVAFLMPLLIHAWMAGVMWISFAFSIASLVSLPVCVRNRPAHRAWILASIPFALYWPALGLCLDWACRYGNDCL